jgi:hypothetical protein
MDRRSLLALDEMAQDGGSFNGDYRDHIVIENASYLKPSRLVMATTAF